MRRPALAAHDASNVPLARDVYIVENIKRIQPGEGLWKTASAVPTTFKIYVPDVVAHQLREANLANLATPRLPLVSPVLEPYRDSRARLLAIGASYYDALDLNNGSLAPFADDCVRFENGGQSARKPVPAGAWDDDFAPFGALGCARQLDTQVMSYITSIDNRRVWIADEENGLAFGLSQFRHAMDKSEYPVFGVPGVTVRKLPYPPFDLPAVHIFKIWAGQIHEIEALGFLAPYNSPTGWEAAVTK